MPTLQLPSVIVREPNDCEAIMRLKAVIEKENKRPIAMAKLIRLALLEMAASKNV